MIRIKIPMRDNELNPVNLRILLMDGMINGQKIER